MFLCGIFVKRWWENNVQLVKNIFEWSEEQIDAITVVEGELLRDFRRIDIMNRLWKASELKKSEGD